MATLRKRGDRYQVVFRRMHNEKRVAISISLGTTSKTIAQKHRRKLEQEQQEGLINVFGDFDFQNWLQSGKGSSSGKVVTLLAAIESFIEDKVNYREKTRKGYLAILGDMASHISPTLPIESVIKQDIVDYLKTGNRKPVSQNTYLRHIRVFFNWAVKAGLLQANPTDGINKKPVDETLSLQIISEQELQLLLDTHKTYIAEQETKGTIRQDWQRQLWFRPLIMTYFYAGLRLSEALRLTWRDINLSQRTLTVRTAKGGKSVVIVLTNKIVGELTRWKKVSTGNLVFPSPKQGLANEIPLVAGTVQKLFKRMVRKSNLDDAIHIHSLRHSCVTYLLSKGVDILSVNRTLRHTSLDVTRRYEHLSPRDIREKFEKLNL